MAMSHKNFPLQHMVLIPKELSVNFNLNLNFFIQEVTGPTEMTLKLKETGFGPLQEIIGWFFFIIVAVYQLQL